MATGDQIERHNGSAPIATTKEGFGTSEMTVAHETSATAVAVQARAKIEARYVVAMQRPRSWDDVRAKLMRDCQRPGFAEVARYSKPVGGSKIEGPSVRFAEAALRAMGNAVIETMVVWDDDEKRTVRVSVTDIENNLPYETDVVVQKTVERSSIKEGQTALAVRTNSSGKKVYIVRATDDDLLNKQNALISKALRTAALRLLPGDILEECMDMVLTTQQNRDAEDPDAARKRMVDAFMKLNITPAQINEYLGHDVGQVVPAELADLRAIHTALRDGDTTWATVMESKRGAAAPEATPTQSAAASVKAKIDTKKGKAAAPVVVDAPAEPSTRPDDEGLHDPSDEGA